jgi:hypothetical protein
MEAGREGGRKGGGEREELYVAEMGFRKTWYDKGIALI